MKRRRFNGKTEENMKSKEFVIRSAIRWRGLPPAVATFDGNKLGN